MQTILFDKFKLVPRDLTIRDRLLPENVFNRHWLFQCNIKILVVTDSVYGGFGKTEQFHLGLVLDIINQDPWNHVNFDFTKAHRNTSEEADVIDNFRFDAHDLSQYSQIWMFGISRYQDDNSLSSNELQAVSDFMDAGGGLFATGDHEDLGNAMCARVPRVRSMRRWYHQNPGPNGEPVAPTQTGLQRHDTIVNNGSQTDAHPQTIRPKYYSRSIGGSRFKLIDKFPHPVLCGPNGVINFLPDHMHEGCCEVPADLSQSFTFNGQSFTEYPSKDGHQEIPEVIAYATNNVDSDEFGVLATYNGHRVNVGRVLVDATWHHWFNINVFTL